MKIKFTLATTPTTRSPPTPAARYGWMTRAVVASRSAFFDIPLAWQQVTQNTLRAVRAKGLVK